MTANALASDREHCLAIGMNDHIPKPIDVAALYATLAHWLGRPDSPRQPPLAAPEATAWLHGYHIDFAKPVGGEQAQAAVLDLLERSKKNTEALIEQILTGGVRDTLQSLVTKLLNAGAIDLKKWTNGVDLSADRVGLLLAHDLEVALEMVRALDDSGAKERAKELLLFAVSEEYFNLRTKLGIGIDS